MGSVEEECGTDEVGQNVAPLELLPLKGYERASMWWGGYGQLTGRNDCTISLMTPPRTKPKAEARSRGARRMYHTRLAGPLTDLAQPG